MPVLAEAPVETGELFLYECVEPSPRPPAAAVWLRPAGQGLIVFAVVGSLLAGELSWRPSTLPATLLVSAIWFAALQGALSSSKFGDCTIGRGCALLTGTITGLLIVSTTTLLMPGMGVHPDRACVLAACIFVLSSAWQNLADRILVRSARVLIVAAGEAVDDLLERVDADCDRRFEIVGIVDDQPKVGETAGVPVYGGLASLAHLVDRKRPDLVVIGLEQERSEVFRHLLDATSHNFVVSGLPEFYEHAFGYVPLRHMTHAWFMSVFHLYQPARLRFVKRGFDLAVASITLLATGPLLLLVALIVRLSHGPVVYRQIRLGEGGRYFTMYKFRTMLVGAESAGEARWAERDDNRTTRIGRLLRRTRIDELPQLVNVLRGDMSIVGPRPERPEFLELLVKAVPFWAQRHLLRPGITGWAQIRNGYSANVTEIELKLSYDLWYLRHQSLLVDLMICAKTFPTLVRGNGAR